ncbi:MAG TPA: HAD-IA family hydrolase [Kofleriaceae bacterium]|nr:HAD-IA family hydrolase [Kofleriaceae bacterium]
MRALILSGGGFQGLALVRLLRADPRAVVVVADIHDRNVTTHAADHYEVVPPLAAPEAFAAAIRELCRRHRIEVVFPATAHELTALAALAGELVALGAVAAVSPPEVVDRLGSKRGLARFCADHGLPAPRLYQANEQELPMPLLLKPDRGWGGRDQRVIRSAAELPADLDAFVLQEIVADFDELSIDFALSAGRRSPVGARRRVRVSGGFAVVAETEHDPAVLGLAHRVIDALLAERAHGLFNLQLLRDGRGLWVTDLNLRIGTSAAHWADQADNPALWFARQAHVPAGETTEPPARRALGVAGTEVVRVLSEVRLIGPPDRGVRAVVFDLDETLICQRSWAAARLVQLASQLEPDPAARAVWLRRALRIAEESGLAHLFDEMAAELGWSEPDKRAVIDAYRACWPAVIEPLPGAVPVLEMLRARGYRLVLLTDNPPETQRRKLELAGLTAAFDAIVFSREHGAEKPDVAAFEVAAGPGGAAARTVMVGDNPYRDAAGALEAGYRRAFLLTHEGHERFHPALWRAALGPAAEECVIEIRSLRELLRYLPGAAA